MTTERPREEDETYDLVVELQGERSYRDVIVRYTDEGDPARAAADERVAVLVNELVTRGVEFGANGEPL